jgi:hypothetical protein
VASPACAEVEADRALSGLTCLNRLFRLIQMLELSRFLWWLLLLRLLRLGRDRGRAPFLVRGPALFHGNRA